MSWGMRRQLTGWATRVQIPRTHRTLDEVPDPWMRCEGGREKNPQGWMMYSVVNRRSWLKHRDKDLYLGYPLTSIPGVHMPTPIQAHTKHTHTHILKVCVFLCCRLYFKIKSQCHNSMHTVPVERAIPFWLYCHITLSQQPHCPVTDVTHRRHKF